MSRFRNFNAAARAAIASLTLALVIGLAGAASADPLARQDMRWSGPQLLWGYALTSGQSDRQAGVNCEGRLGVAILGGFANASDMPRVGQACRY
jgi:hypothetical protein